MASLALHTGIICALNNCIDLFYFMIKVYTSHSCFYCTRAKNYLDNLDIEYETLNIQEDSDARNFFMKSGFRTVPQIFVNDTLLVKGGSDGLVQMSKEDIQNKVLEITGSEL
jgi:glutaredoxin